MNWQLYFLVWGLGLFDSLAGAAIDNNFLWIGGIILMFGNMCGSIAGQDND